MLFKLKSLLKKNKKEFQLIKFLLPTITFLKILKRREIFYLRNLVMEKENFTKTYDYLILNKIR